jgi:hypothetical protein
LKLAFEIQGENSMLNILIVHWISVLAATSENSNQFGSILLPIVGVVGFAAAVGLGSLAWYNSKRPVGWEDKDRPAFVPKVEESQTPGLGKPNP